MHANPISQGRKPGSGSPARSGRAGIPNHAFLTAVSVLPLMQQQKKRQSFREKAAENDIHVATHLQAKGLFTAIHSTFFECLFCAKNCACATWNHQNIKGYQVAGPGDREKDSKIPELAPIVREPA